MQTVDNDRVLRFDQESTVLLWCQSELSLESPGEIAVVGEARLFANIQQFFLVRAHQLAGTVDTHRIDVVLKALVQRILDEVGQIVQRAVLRLGKVRQPDRV